MSALSAPISFRGWVSSAPACRLAGAKGARDRATAARTPIRGNDFGLNLGAQYLSRNFAQLSDLEPGQRIRTNQFASASVFSQDLGSVSATYTALTSYDGPNTKLWNISYTLGVFGEKGLLALNYNRTLEPQSISPGCFRSAIFSTPRLRS